MCDNTLKHLQVASTLIFLPGFLLGTSIHKLLPPYFNGGQLVVIYFFNKFDNLSSSIF
jgi:hypothetical protein